jgi:hypothetical protein
MVENSEGVAMKRWMGIAVVVAMLLGLPLSHGLLAQKPGDVPRGKPRVEICHIDEGGRGRFITVAEPAVPAHLNHGDCLGADAEVIVDELEFEVFGECQCTAAE